MCWRKCNIFDSHGGNDTIHDNDTVNIENSWDNIFCSSIAEGMSGGGRNSFETDFRSKDWAPWIPVNTYRETVYNTEHKKTKITEQHLESEMLHNLSEEMLDTLLKKGSKQSLLETCIECGIENADRF